MGHAESKDEEAERTRRIRAGGGAAGTNGDGDRDREEKKTGSSRGQWCPRVLRQGSTIQWKFNVERARSGADRPRSEPVRSQFKEGLERWEAGKWHVTVTG